MGNREKIVEAALHSFTHQGFHQTSMRDIAQAAGVSVGNLYNHFSGKEALIGEIALLENGVFAEFAAGLLADRKRPKQALSIFSPPIMPLSPNRPMFSCRRRSWRRWRATRRWPSRSVPTSGS